MINRISLVPKSAGLTVVELLIAVALSLMIMAGAASIFMGSKETFKLEEDLSRHQESLRYISDLFLKDFGMVGFLGCSESVLTGSSKFRSHVTGPGLVAGVRPAIVGQDGGDANTPDAVEVWYGLVETVTPIIRSMDYRPELLVGKSGHAGPIVIPASSALYLALEDNFSKSLDEQRPILLYASDCNSTDMFLATGVATNPGDAELGEIAHEENEGSPIAEYFNDTDALDFPYGMQNQSSAYLYQVETVSYSTQAYVEDGETLYNLRVRRNTGNAETILSGVKNFQIRYGMGPGQYVDWNNGAGLDQASITSVKFILTLPTVSKPVEFIVKLRNA